MKKIKIINQIQNDKNIIINHFSIHKRILTKRIQNFLKILIIFYSLIFFCRNYFILHSKKEIIIDNKLDVTKENNIDFSKFKTTIKPIAFYNPNIYLINETNNNSKNFLWNNNTLDEINTHIKLAKMHGIYGFGFHYFNSNQKCIFNEPLDIIISNPNLTINFLLIWENNEFFGVKESWDDNNISEFFDGIKKYIIDKRYIKYDNKPIIGINRGDFNEIIINNLRQKFRENNLSEIFILSKSNDKNIKYLYEKKIYNGLYYSTSYDSLQQIIFYFNNTYNYLYTHLLYENLKFPFNINSKNKNDTYIFRISIPVQNCPIAGPQKNIKIYGDYTPDKFYFLNKIIIDWTKKNYNNDSQYIFIEGFTKDNFLESDDKTGFSNINSFSKALYGLPLLDPNLTKNNLSKLQKGVFILVQAHVFYTDILPEVVNKTNNIPAPFDLYITTNTEEKKSIIEKYLKINSKANKYEILITENKGRDAIPFLIQVKNIITNYKYICHIHTKKHGYTIDEGENWRIYLYENLLGNKNIVSKILSDFENDEKLGFFFPDHYHIQFNYIYNWNRANAKQINHFFEILFPKMKIKVGDTLDFPVGNMFWARTKAIYQLFDDKIIKLCPKENGQIDGTVLHGIERVWLYLVKINGFFYKCNLYYLY